MNKRLKKIAVAVSGSGRTLEHLARHQGNRRDFEVAAVIASRTNCPAFAIGRSLSLPVMVADFTDLSQDSEVAKYLYDWLDRHDIAMVALAGFIKAFPCRKDWNHRIINIHPALLPKYGGKGMYGMNVHKAVLAAGERESGATVHFVDESYDSGAIIAQSRVAIAPQDTYESLANKVFASESQMYPAVIADLLAGRLPLEGGKIKIF
jgi:folate-dependent phosphoribosylglycinamide formyltransferase PurN